MSPHSIPYKRRVVVTGLGCVSPVGHNVQDAWQNLLAGQSGVGVIERFDTTDCPIKIAACVKDLNIESVIDKKSAKKMDTFIQYGLVAVDEALKQSGLPITDDNAHRIGCAIGSGIGGIDGIEHTHTTLQTRGARRVSPFFVPSIIVNMVSGYASMMFGLKGPSTAIATACATGTHNIGEAMRMIAYGDADAMVAGGAESCITPLTLAGFASAKALSTQFDEPEKACRPFDEARDGFVMGEGAGVLVLEEYEHAKARGATILAELSGFGMSSDAYHITNPSENGEGASRCMHNALADAQLPPQYIGYINAHGTSTPAGDLAETQAIKNTFGAHAYHLNVSSTKSMTGHLLGAAGGVEAVFSVMALHTQMLPPTINLNTPSKGCDLNYTANQSVARELEHVLSNSFGFGGTNASLIFSKPHLTPTA